MTVRTATCCVHPDNVSLFPHSDSGSFSNLRWTGFGVCHRKNSTGVIVCLFSLLLVYSESRSPSLFCAGAKSGLS